MKNWRTLAAARDELINTGETSSVEEAEQRIIGEFADGRRRAEGVVPGSVGYEPISEALWLQAKGPPPPPSPPWMPPLIKVDFEAGSAIAGTGQAYHHIRELLSLLPDETTVPADATPPASPRAKKAGTSVPRSINPGGRPPEYDWEKLLFETVNIADMDRLPDRPTLMRMLYDKMNDWGWEQQPSESWMKQNLRRLYEHLNLLGKGF